MMSAMTTSLRFHQLRLGQLVIWWWGGHELQGGSLMLLIGVPYNFKVAEASKCHQIWQQSHRIGNKMHLKDK